MTARESGALSRDERVFGGPTVLCGAPSNLREAPGAETTLL
jgi:hypothetical protein